MFLFIAIHSVKISNHVLMLFAFPVFETVAYTRHKMFFILFPASTAVSINFYVVCFL